MNVVCVLCTSRTARGQDSGAALTFITPSEEEFLSELEGRLKGAGPEGSSASTVKPYKFRMSEIEGFRYRVKVRPALGAVEIWSLHHTPNPAVVSHLRGCIFKLPTVQAR